MPGALGHPGGKSTLSRKQKLKLTLFLIPVYVLAIPVMMVIFALLIVVMPFIVLVGLKYELRQRRFIKKMRKQGRAMCWADINHLDPSLGTILLEQMGRNGLKWWWIDGVDLVQEAKVQIPRLDAEHPPEQASEELIAFCNRLIEEQTDEKTGRAIFIEQPKEPGWFPDEELPRKFKMITLGRVNETPVLYEGWPFG